MNRETKIGIFLVIALAVSAFFILRLGDDGFGAGLFNAPEAQEVRVVVDDASGIREGTAVRVAGVQVGKVDRLELVGGKAEVVLKVPATLAIPANSYAELRTQGVLGERFVALILGSGEPASQPVTLAGQTPVSLDNITATLNEIGNEVLALTKSLRESTNSADGENRIASIVENLDRLTALLAQTVEKNQTNVDQTMANFNALSADLRTSLPELIAEMKDITSEFKSMAQANRGNVDGTMDRVHSISEKLDKTMDSIQSVAKKVDSGQGMIGKLVNDDETGEKLDTLLDSANRSLAKVEEFIAQGSNLDLQLGFSVDYLEKHEGTISNFQLKISPNDRKYYLLEAFSRDTDYFPMEFDTITENHYDADGNLIRRSERFDPDEPKDFGFSGQLAYRFGDLFLRGGLIEGDGGAGLDWLLFQDRAKVTFDAFDFSRPEDLSPRTRLKLEFNAVKGMHFRFGWDDFLEDDYQSATFGLGLKWRDDDLKPLITSLGRFL